MKLIVFKNNSSQRVYNEYIERCRKSIKSLADADKEECLLEINSHIYEYMQDHQLNDEMESLLDVLEKLGRPEETLKEYVAAKKINQAVKTFNPKHVVQALYLNIRNGIAYILLSVMGLFFCGFLFLIIFKIIYPQNVGLFIGTDTFLLGHTTSPDFAEEVLGNWFIPTMILSAGFLYLVIVFILKIIRK